MVSYQKFIRREDLQLNPNTLYLFGDNLLRVGMGGQAGAMRGEPNAVGVATKKSPGMSPKDFFTDDELEENTRVFLSDLKPALKHLMEGGDIVIPQDGLGTGLSRMPELCPQSFLVLSSFLLLLSTIGELDHKDVTV